jgi:lipopolysaccharide export system protein LptA
MNRIALIPTKLIKFCAAIFTAVAVMSVPQFAFAEKADLTKELIALGKLGTVADGDSPGDGETNIFEGNVDIEQGTLKITAHKLLLKNLKNGYRFGEALGKLNAPVKFRQKREGKDSYVDGTAERVVYDEQKETIQMFGNVKVKLGEDEFNGQYVTYNMTTDKFILDGAPNAASTAKSGVATDGRIRVVLKPRLPVTSSEVTNKPATDAATPKK